MKTAREIIAKVVNFVFNLILPADSEMNDLRNMKESEVFKKLQKVSEQKYSDMFAIFSYKDKLVRKMIWQMKFRECYWVAEVFGKFLACGVLKLISKENYVEEIFLVPIPLHHKRYAERGYNQCEWLCNEILRNISRMRVEGVKVLPKIIYNKNTLKRTKYRTKQSWSSRADRFKNSENIFAVSDDSPPVLGASIY
jgi:predicted amidophosphoribosyltransferase